MGQQQAPEKWEDQIGVNTGGNVDSLKKKKIYLFYVYEFSPACIYVCIYTYIHNVCVCVCVYVCVHVHHVPQIPWN